MHASRQNHDTYVGSNMKTIFTTPAAKMALVKTALVSGMLMAVAPGIVMADPIEKKGITPYVTHFIFRPVQSLEVPGLGTATLLEAVGTTQNMKGEKMLDKMSARCTALSVDFWSQEIHRRSLCPSRYRR